MEACYTPQISLYHSDNTRCRLCILCNMWSVNFCPHILFNMRINLSKHILLWRAVSAYYTSEEILTLFFAVNITYSMSRSTPRKHKHMYNICTMLGQRRRRLANVVQMLYKCFVLAGRDHSSFQGGGGGGAKGLSRHFVCPTSTDKKHGTFLLALISKTWSKVCLLESVTFQLHDRMLNSFPATTLISNGHFSDL